MNESRELSERMTLHLLIFNIGIPVRDTNHSEIDNTTRGDFPRSRTRSTRDETFDRRFKNSRIPRM